MIEDIKQQAISTIASCAAEYDKNLNDCRLLFILKDRYNHASFFEASFYSYNFLHLTGIKLIGGITAADFYSRCLNHKISSDDFVFAADGTTVLKLEVLPQLVKKDVSARMVGNFIGCNPKLYTEKLAGGVKACLGFVKTDKDEYVPNTVLNTDIRTTTVGLEQVVATYRRKKTDLFYHERVYKTKKIDLTNFTFPKEYSYLARLEWGKD